MTADEKHRRRFIPDNPVRASADGRPRRLSPYLTPERLDRGLVVCLDGVGGYNWLPRLLRRGLDRGGVDAAIVIYNWSVGPLGMWAADLIAQRRNRQMARDLAETIVGYRERMPGRPITLVGHSGGGGLAAWTLEALPEGVAVDRALLLAPALSPRYNLAGALAHVRHRLLATYSWGDVGLMGLGTTLFGTMDRRFGPSAGLVGFRLPPGLTAGHQAAYEKFRQMGWRPRMIRDGHLGEHTGWTGIRFARRILAPFVLGQTDHGQALAG
ncbi:MAG: alpha/beta hydrolase [Planctomycetes bacterium]|nr:alpha/beta hydrolase [Planctomycetota bacterium]